MGKGVKIGIIIIVIAVVTGSIAWALGNSEDNNSSTQTNTSEPNNAADHNETAVQNDDELAATTITYTANGFEPSETTVKSGDKVKIVNESGDPLEFSSDPHPSHTINPELNAGDTENGQSTTITLTKTGTWGFHNHYNASDHGSITVE